MSVDIEWIKRSSEIQRCTPKAILDCVEQRIIWLSSPRKTRRFPH